MIERIKKLFQTPEQSYLTEVSEKTSVCFSLYFESLLIGTLTLDKGHWEFQYSEDFKGQDQVQPLVNFPNKERVYKSHELFPFFALRIPGEGQLKAKGFDVKSKSYSDPVELLRLFGKKNIANPYTLRLAW
jgi:HipA-like protein